jgi:hypothetical protein
VKSEIENVYFGPFLSAPTNYCVLTDFWSLGHQFTTLRSRLYEYHILSTINAFRTFSYSNHLTVVFIYTSGRTYYYNRETKETTWTKVCHTTIWTIILTIELISAEKFSHYWAILFFTESNRTALTMTCVRWFLCVECGVVKSLTEGWTIRPLVLK